MVASAYKDFKNLADGASTTLDVVLNTTIKNGFIIFEVGHCGASDITKAGAYWDVSGLEPPNGGKQKTSIPIAAAWDNGVYSMIPIRNIAAQTYTFTFTNHTGVATNSGYNSRVQAYFIKLN